MSSQNGAEPRQLTFGLTLVARTVVAWTIFPVVFCACIAMAILALQGGVEPALVTAAISVVAAVILLAMEVVQPHARSWLASHDDVPTDIAHLLFSTMLIPPLFEALFRSGLLLAAGWLAMGTGMSLWPQQWPLVSQLALALCVGEFCQYWWHRLAHEKEFLWRFHATHHSSQRLYWLNSCRFHPVDSVVQYTLEMGPLVLLGCGVETLALFTLSTAVIGMFQHANIELRGGPLNWIFSLTELHRWHHSRDVREGNSNYGANLIIWDIIFGTRFLPSDRSLAANGIGLATMPNFPQRYLGQLLSPFRWRKLKDEATSEIRPSGNP